MSYDQTQPYGPYDVPPPPPPDAAYPQKKKESNAKWILPSVIVPIVVALITLAGILIHNANSGPSIPQLHTNYAGTAINLSQQRQYTMSLINISEDTSNGTFTGNMTIQQCAGQVVNGIVTTTGKVTFTEDEEQNAAGTCGTFVTNFDGQINSAGGIAGTWDAPNGGGNGSFSVS